VSVDPSACACACACVYLISHSIHPSRPVLSRSLALACSLSLLFSNNLALVPSLSLPLNLPPPPILPLSPFLSLALFICIHLSVYYLYRYGNCRCLHAGETCYLRVVARLARRATCRTATGKRSACSEVQARSDLMVLTSVHGGRVAVAVESADGICG